MEVCLIVSAPCCPWTWGAPAQFLRVSTANFFFFIDVFSCFFSYLIQILGSFPAPPPAMFWFAALRSVGLSLFSPFHWPRSFLKPEIESFFFGLWRPFHRILRYFPIAQTIVNDFEPSLFSRVSSFDTVFRLIKSGWKACDALKCVSLSECFDAFHQIRVGLFFTNRISMEWQSSFSPAQCCVSGALVSFPAAVFFFKFSIIFLKKRTTSFEFRFHSEVNLYWSAHFFDDSYLWPCRSLNVCSCCFYFCCVALRIKSSNVSFVFHSSDPLVRVRFFFPFRLCRLRRYSLRLIENEVVVASVFFFFIAFACRFF